MQINKPTRIKDTIWDAMAKRYKSRADYSNPVPTLEVNGHKKEAPELELIAVDLILIIHKRLGCIITVNAGRHITLSRNLSFEEDKERAYQLGRKAYIDNKCCLAISDKALMSLIDGYSELEQDELRNAWDNGWLTIAAKALSSSLNTP